MSKPDCKHKPTGGEKFHSCQDGRFLFIEPAQPVHSTGIYANIYSANGSMLDSKYCDNEAGAVWLLVNNPAPY